MGSVNSILFQSPHITPKKNEEPEFKDESFSDFSIETRDFHGAIPMLYRNQLLNRDWYGDSTPQAPPSPSPKKITQVQNAPPSLLKKIASVAAVAALILGLGALADSTITTPSPPPIPVPQLPPVNFSATSAEAGAAQGIAITTLAFLAYTFLFKSEPKPPVNIYQHGSVVMQPGSVYLGSKANYNGKGAKVYVADLSELRRVIRDEFSSFRRNSNASGDPSSCCDFSSLGPMIRVIGDEEVGGQEE